MRHFERVGGASVVLAVALFAACGGKVVIDTPSAAGGGGSGGTGGIIVTGPAPPNSVASSSTGTISTVVSSVSSTSTGFGGTGGTVPCPQSPDCFQCCADQNPAAYAQFVAIVVKLCACGSPMMKCFMPCSDPNQNTCADPQLLGMACTDCINEELNNGSSCGPNAQMTCMADSTCAPLFDCFGTCQ